MWYVAFLVFTQAAWIGFLLLEHRRRTKLELDREKTAEALRESESKNRAILEALPDMMFVMDEHGTYLDWYANDRSNLYVPPEQFLGKTLHEVLPNDVSKECGQAIENVLSSGTPARVEYSLRIDGEDRFFETRIVRCKDRKLLSIARDISELKRAEVELQQLSSQLLSLQDDERRRVARELHDTTAQHLFAITINLENLKRLSTGISRQGVEILNECRDLCEQSLKEVRTLAYLRNPQQLVDTSLISALQWYVEGFQKRTGIAVDFQPADSLGKLPGEMEVDLFRLVQEGLYKVFRQSGSRSVTIILTGNDDRVVLEIKDNEDRLPRNSKRDADLGTARANNTIGERLRRWGGHVEVESNGTGPLLVAEIPLSTVAARIAT